MIVTLRRKPTRSNPLWPGGRAARAFDLNDEDKSKGDRCVKVDAIFQNGVFKPVSLPELREGERVRLTVERVAQGDVAEIEAEARALP
jgi:predicted DNA-binding antitoxin AbrB/MazE fold protein